MKSSVRHRGGPAANKARLSLEMDVENITNNLYLVAQESEFAAGQYSIPRLVAASAKLRF